MKFTELGLSEPLVRAVADKGYTTPSPIQAAAIPMAIEGLDILGCAQTGTGKTCAFALPILHRLSEKKPRHGKQHHKNGFGRRPRALVLCPTRELASQIFESFVAYGRNLNLRHGVVFGGVKQGKQVRTIRAGVDVLVATPGRLLDLINQGHIDLSQIETLVLDEADRMLDMGFINDIRKVIDMIPEERQTLFFSATVSREIRKLTDSILVEPMFIQTTPESTTAEAIKQRIYTVERGHKGELLERILCSKDVVRSLVFTRTKHGADKLVKFLRHSDIDAEAIHGDKSQNARTRTMRRFKAGSTRVLVATDIASRGIDVDEITHVVNFDMPIDPETYVHRIGRTARAGASGIAISLCDYEELGIYRAIERRTKIQIEVGRDHEDLTYNAPDPVRRNRGGGGGGGGKYQKPRNNKQGARGRFSQSRQDEFKPNKKKGKKQSNAAGSRSSGGEYEVRTKPKAGSKPGSKKKYGGGNAKATPSGARKGGRVHKSAISGGKPGTRSRRPAMR